MAISAAELAQMQADWTALMDLMVTVQHVSTAPGTHREAVQTNSGAAFSVRCLIGEPSDEALALYGPKIGEHFAWRLVVPTSTVLAVGDQVTLPNGITGTVIGPDLVKSYPVYNAFIVIAVR